MAILAIFESTQLQVWEFHFNEFFCNLSFLKISKKKYKSSRISQTKMIWAFLIGVRICNPWDYSDSPLNTDWEFQILKKINKFIFHEFFFEKITKRHIWKTARFWEVLFGGENRSPIWRQNSQLLRVPWQSLTTEIISSFVKLFSPKFSEKFWKKYQKTHVSKTTRIWAAILRGTIRSPWE